MRIVILDDNSAMGEAYQRVLKKAGHDVEFFNSGSKALDGLKTADLPHLLLVDCSMPEENGEDFLVRLERQLPNAYGDMKIVGLSSYPEDSIMVQTFQNKVDLFVEKPDDAQGLVKVVEEIVQRLGLSIQ